MTPAAPPALPLRYREAVWRGMRSQCPRCAGASMFGKWLKPVDRCTACGQSWTAEMADDFPAYIAIFVTGHVVAPLLIWLIAARGLSPWVTLAVILPLAVAMMLALLQPAKGAVLATMWWSGMGAFAHDRPSPPPDHP